MGIRVRKFYAECCWSTLLLKPETLLLGRSWYVWVLLGSQVEQVIFLLGSKKSPFSLQLPFLSWDLWGPLFEWCEGNSRSSIITLLASAGRFPLLALSVQPGVFKWQDPAWTIVKVSHPPPQCHAYYSTTDICKLRQKSKLSLKYSELVRGLYFLNLITT